MIRVLGATPREWGAWASGLIPRRSKQIAEYQQAEDATRLEARATIAKARVAMASMRTGNGLGYGGDKYRGALSFDFVRTMDHVRLRRRSRIAYWDSVQARALIGRLVDNVINTGLRLEAAPVWSVLDQPKARDEKNRAEWQRQAEARFGLWAQSDEPDAAGKMDLYEMQEFLFRSLLRDGEVFVVYRQSPEKSRINPLMIQFLDPDQIATPTSMAAFRAAKARGNRIRDGIELDKNGREVAFYVHDTDTGDVKRMPVRGPKSGRLFASHIGIFDRVGQVRATPPLTAVIHELQKLTDYQVAEIEAAVINATIAAWIEPSDIAPASRALGGVAVRGSAQAKTDAGDTRSAPPADGVIREPGMMIQTLGPGEKLQSYDTKRPNQGYEVFVNSVLSHISMSLGIPVEVLAMSFSANYSASRASLLLFWSVVEMWRAKVGSDFLDHVYAGWLAIEVAARRIAADAWDIPVFRAAWLNSNWIGINQPSIDPARESKAAHQRIADGLTTRSRESRKYNGSEYDENIERLGSENASLAAVNQPLEAQPAGGAE